MTDATNGQTITHARAAERDEVLDKARRAKAVSHELAGYTSERKNRILLAAADALVEQADKILGKIGVQDELLDIAKELEEIALTDDFFVERKLYPNVDYYTGVIYRAMGFPTRMFTVLFALGRLPGWIAHWREMHGEPNKIGRPRQIYTGYTERDFTDLSDR